MNAPSSALRVYVRELGEKVTIYVEATDEHGRPFEFPIEVEMMHQKEPRLIGVKVMHRPVLLRANDCMIHSAGPLRSEEEPK